MSNLAPQSHHPLGPSQWPMLSACIRFEGRKDVDPEDLDVAELLPEEIRGREDMKTRGTAMHAALAALASPDPTVRAGALDGLLNDHERGQVQWVREKVLEIGAMHGYGPDELVVEERVVKMDGESFRILYFGTLDGRFGPAVIIDAKFGDIRDYFPQHVGYALPLMEEFGVDRTYAYTVYGRWRRTQDYVITKDTAETVAYGLLRKRADPNAKPTPCQYCGWCQHTATCEAFTAPIVALVDRRDDWPFKLSQVHVSKIGTDPVMLGAARLIWKAYLEPWGEAVEFYSKTVSEGGIIPVGFTRRVNKPSWYVEDVGKALRALRAAGLPEDSILEALSVSVGALVTAWRKAFNVSEAKAKDAVVEILSKTGAGKQGEGVSMLIRDRNAVDIIRDALARHPSITAPKDLTERSTAPTSNAAPQGPAD